MNPVQNEEKTAIAKINYAVDNKEIFPKCGPQWLIQYNKD